MRKLGRDSTREVPSAVSSRQKIGHEREVLDVLLGEMLDVISVKNTDSSRNFNKYWGSLEKVIRGWSG
jgi:hypothetical protein